MWSYCRCIYKNHIILNGPHDEWINTYITLYNFQKCWRFNYHFDCWWWSSNQFALRIYNTREFHKWKNFMVLQRMTMWAVNYFAHHIHTEWTNISRPRGTPRCNMTYIIPKDYIQATYPYNIRKYSNNSKTHFKYKIYHKRKRKYIHFISS